MKALIETTGDFMLFNVSTGEVVEADRPSLVTDDYFVQAQFAIGSIRVLAREFPDERTDAEWAEWLKASDGNLELAIASFGSEPEPKQPEEPQLTLAEAKAKVKAKAKAEAAEAEAEGG